MRKLHPGRLCTLYILNYNKLPLDVKEFFDHCTIKETPFLKKFPVIWLSSIFTKNRNRLQFYIRNPFKNESDQTKSSQKNWTHLQFHKRNPFKKFSDQKKINPEIRPQKYPLGPSSWRPFFKNSLLEGDFENCWGNSPTTPKFNTH